MDKKQLYENIMRNVSKQVKKTLNESVSNDDETMFVATSFSFRVIEDDYKHGEIGNEQIWDEDYKYYANTIQELIQKVADNYGYDANNVVAYDNQVLINCMTDKDLAPLTDDEMKAWRNGKIKAYATELRFSIYKQISHNELVASGIESYD